MKEELFSIAVIGAGAAGSMAYLRSVLNFDNTVLFTGSPQTTKRGRGTWVSEVDNMPGLHEQRYPIVSTSKSTIKWVESQDSLKDKSTVIKAAVSKVIKQGDHFELHYELKKESKIVKANYIILATGIMDTLPNIQGSIEPVLAYSNRNDILYCIRCDGHRVYGHDLSIIGHTDTAIYIGSILKERYNNEKVYILTNGEKAEFSGSAMRLANAYEFQIIEDEITEVLGNPKEEGLKGYKLANGTELHTSRSVVSLGYRVYNQLLTELGGEVTEEGRVVVSDKFETTVPNIFAVGDMIADRKMQIYTAWDEAVDAADEINKRIRHQKREALLPGS